MMEEEMNERGDGKTKSVTPKSSFENQIDKQLFLNSVCMCGVETRYGIINLKKKHFKGIMYKTPHVIHVKERFLENSNF